MSHDEVLGNSSLRKRDRALGVSRKAKSARQLSEIIAGENSRPFRLTGDDARPLVNKPNLEVGFNYRS